MRIVKSSRRVRMLDRGDVVSDLLLEPGPTHDLFDVLAAALLASRGGDRIALLGFAAGGVVAPIRAMGYAGPLVAVDSSDRGHRIFRDVAAGWSGRIRFERAEAGAWLGRRRAPLDAVLEDLSVPAAGGHVKPGTSYLDLPRAIADVLAPGGHVVVNVLPDVERSVAATLAAVSAPWRHALVVTGEEWENRVVVAGRRRLDGRAFGRRLRGLLDAIGSKESSRIRVRALD